MPRLGHLLMKYCLHLRHMHARAIGQQSRLFRYGGSKEDGSTTYLHRIRISAVSFNEGVLHLCGRLGCVREVRLRYVIWHNGRHWVRTLDNA